jgi:hypothetical protein
MSAKKDSKTKLHTTPKEKAVTPIDWTTVLPTTRLKSILHENSNVGVLPKKTMDFVAVTSAWFLRDLVEAAKSKTVPSEAINAQHVQQAARNYDFMSETIIDEMVSRNTSTTSHLLNNKSSSGKRKRPTTKTSQGETADVTHKNGKRVAADQTFIEHASELVPKDTAGNTVPSQLKIELDKEEYD